MSYASVDVSVQSGRPLLLFLIVQGSTTYRYTTQAQNVSFLSNTWVPAPITCGSFGTTNDYPKDSIMLKLPVGNALAASFLGASTDQITTVSVYRAQYGETDYRIYWKGRVASSSLTGGYVSLECEPVFSSLRRPGLRQVYTRTCRHVLYGAGCGLVLASFTASGTVTAIGTDGVTLTITEAAASASGHFIGGMVWLASGDARTIIAHAGTSVTMLKPFPALSAALVETPSGVAVSLAPGCSHTIETCEEKFNNKGNFGGDPWMPIVNPYRTSMG